VRFFVVLQTGSLHQFERVTDMARLDSTKPSNVDCFLVSVTPIIITPFERPVQDHRPIHIVVCSVMSITGAQFHSRRFHHGTLKTLHAFAKIFQTDMENYQI
jgi:hypothetical protein